MPNLEPETAGVFFAGMPIASQRFFALQTNFSRGGAALRPPDLETPPRHGFRGAPASRGLVAASLRDALPASAATGGDDHPRRPAPESPFWRDAKSHPPDARAPRMTPAPAPSARRAYPRPFSARLRLCVSIPTRHLLGTAGVVAGSLAACRITLKAELGCPRNTRKDAKGRSSDFHDMHPAGASGIQGKLLCFRVFRVFRGLHRRF